MEDILKVLQNPYQVGTYAALGLGVWSVFRILQDSEVPVKRFFDGKRVIITGASAGIGKELALRLATYHTQLTLMARTESALEKVAEECKEKGAEGVLTIVGDVALKEDCQRCIDQSVLTFKGIDVLILNAGISMSAMFESIEDPDTVFRQIMDVNYHGCVNLTHCALRHIKKSKGTIAVVSSQAAVFSPPLRSGYVASKAAVNAFFDALRNELGPNSGVKISMLLPGFISTDIRKRSYGGDKTKYKEEKMMSTKECVSISLKAIARGVREERYTFAGQIGPLLKAVAPNLVSSMIRAKVASILKD